MQFVEVNSTTS